MVLFQQLIMFSDWSSSCFILEKLLYLYISQNTCYCVVLSTRREKLSIRAIHCFHDLPLYLDYFTSSNDCFFTLLFNYPSFWAECWLFLQVSSNPSLLSFQQCTSFLCDFSPLKCLTNFHTFLPHQNITLDWIDK